MAVDRVGIALLGAIAMVISGVVTPEKALHCIDWPTILLLYSLMIISAQLRLGGFYTWLAGKFSVFLSRPRFFLLVLMLASAFLSAMLANDIVCYAFTPVLAVSLMNAGLNPLPFLIGLAVSSNIGSAATIIGNPQNMLIGQLGRLDFAKFLFWSSPPSIIALFAGYALILWRYRGKIYRQNAKKPVDEVQTWPNFNQWQTIKGIVSVVILMVLFFSSIPREFSAVGIAGVLLCSRKMKTRDMLGLVDWHLITLFCALFIIIQGISQGGFLNMIVNGLEPKGLDLRSLPVLSAISVVLSNIVSNVPAVMLLVGFLDPLEPRQWYTLALSSTFAGNLFLLGSIANLIVVEQASVFGIRINFKQHAAVGVPVTLVSLLILVLWIHVR